MIEATGPAAAQRSNERMNKLLLRVITAVVLLAVLVVVFFKLPKSAAAGLLGAFVLMAAWEWSGFLRVEQIPRRAAYVALILVLMALSLWLFPKWMPLWPLLSISLLWWAVAFLWVLRYPTPIGTAGGALAGVLVLIPAWASLLTLLRNDQHGPEYVLFVLAIVWAADIGAYFVGRRFGRVKLAPRVSPGKTWEGALGGVIAAAGAAWVGARLLELPVVFLVPVGLSVAAISIVGDLTVSMFKRSSGLKDSGYLFPGHGGVLDRVDGVTAAVPLFTLEVFWFGLVAS